MKGITGNNQYIKKQDQTSSVPIILSFSFSFVAMRGSRGGTGEPDPSIWKIKSGYRFS